MRDIIFIIIIVLLAWMLFSGGDSTAAVKPEAACAVTRNGGCYGKEYCYDTGDFYLTCYHEYNGQYYDRDGNPMP